MNKKLLALFTLVTLGSLVLAQTAPSTPVRMRGTVEKFAPGTLVLKERSGEVITLAMPDSVPVTEVFPIGMGDIKPGGYIGTTAITKPDGTLEALEVHVFAESSRGVGEGHRPWDLQPQSTMTNATVASLVAAPSGQTLQLKYKDGEKTVHVPKGIPIVTYRPGDNTLLVSGAKVFVTAELRNGQPTVLRISAGRNGFSPPM